MTYPVAMNILNRRLKFQITIFYYKELKKWLISGLPQELSKMNPDQLFVSINKEAIND